MSDDTVDRVESAAAAPQRAKTAAGEVEAHRLADQIAADKYLRARRITNPFMALSIGSFVPPNALGDYERRDYLPPLPPPTGS
jgi:hypothetical protein